VLLSLDVGLEEGPRRQCGVAKRTPETILYLFRGVYVNLSLHAISGRICNYLQKLAVLYFFYGLIGKITQCPVLLGLEMYRPL
jgi:hypothetical protein